MAAVRARRRWATRTATPAAVRGAVKFQVELTFEGVVDGLDELADLLEHRFAVPLLLPLARGA
jgi:hypothetical protein